MNLTWVLVGLLAAGITIVLMLFIAYGPFSKRRPTTDDIRLPDELQNLTQTALSLVGILTAQDAQVLALEGHFDLPNPEATHPIAERLTHHKILWQWRQQSNTTYGAVQMQVAYTEVLRVLTEAFVQANWRATDVHRQEIGEEGAEGEIRWLHLTQAQGQPEL